MRKIKGRPAFRWSTVCMGCVMAMGSGWAQTQEEGAEPPTSGFVLPQAQELLDASWGEATVPLSAVDLVGHTVFSDDELQALVAPYLGREGQAEQWLEQLRVDLTRHYVDRGYVNSGAIIEQLPDAQGRARVRVVEGRLTQFRITGLDGLEEAYVTSRLWPDVQRVFNMNEMQEDFQILLGNPLFEKMRSNVEPGAQLGEALLDLQVQRARPWSAYVGVDNYRSPLSGEYQVISGMTARNFTGWGDWLDVSVNATEKPKDTSAYALGYNFPVPYLGTILGLSATKGQTLVTDPAFKLANFNNSSRSTGVSLTQPVWESLGQALVLGAEWQNRQSRNFVGSTPHTATLGEDEGYSENRVARYSVTYSQRTPSWVGMVRGTFSRGHHSLAGSPALPANSIPPNDYRSTLWQALVSYRFSPQWVGTLRGTAQRTSMPLIGMERYSPTGMQAVRGYLQNQDVYDNVRTGSVELQWVLPAWDDMQWSLTPFYDVGQGWNVISATELTGNRVNYAARGVGLAVQWNAWSLNLSYAKPLKNVESIMSGYAQSRGVQFQLRYVF